MLVSSGENGVTKQTRNDRLARSISTILHPFVVTVCSVPLIVILAESDFQMAIFWMAAFFGIVVAPVLALLLYQVQQQHVDNVEVPVRRQRTIFYAVGIVGLLLLLCLMVLTNAPTLLRTSVIAAVVTNLVAVSVNHYLTKISVHAAAIAGCTAVFMAVAPWPLAAVMMVLTLLQGWARIHLTRHTMGQVVLGWGVAAMSVALIFTILR